MKDFQDFLLGLALLAAVIAAGATIGSLVLALMAVCLAIGLGVSVIWGLREIGRYLWRAARWRRT